jgi:hypothetical protein
VGRLVLRNLDERERAVRAGLLDDLDGSHRRVIMSKRCLAGYVG